MSPAAIHGIFDRVCALTKGEIIVQNENQNNERGDIIFRQATIEDIPAMTEAKMRTWEVGYTEIFSQRYLETMRENIGLRIQRFIGEPSYLENRKAIVSDGVVIGTIAFKETEADEDYDGGLEIRALYVNPDYDQQAIKTQAIEHVCSVAKELGENRLVTWELEANERELAFYQANGFYGDGVCKTMKFGEPFTAIRLAKTV